MCLSGYQDGWNTFVVISLKISNFSFTTFQSTTFHVVYKNVPGALTLDWTDGFLLKPFASPTYAFTYRYSLNKVVLVNVGV